TTSVIPAASLLRCSSSPAGCTATSNAALATAIPTTSPSGSLVRAPLCSLIARQPGLVGDGRERTAGPGNCSGSWGRAARRPVLFYGLKGPRDERPVAPMYSGYRPKLHDF